MKKLKKLFCIICCLGVISVFLYITKIGCPIKRVTGISCPGCGMTRAVFAIVTLQVQKAFVCHPMFWILPVIVVLYFLWDRIPEKIQKVLLGAGIFLCMGIYILRMLNPNDHIVVCHPKEGLFVQLVNKIINL